MLNKYNLLLKLSRFISPSEQRMIAEDIVELLPTSAKINNDPWGHQRRLLINLNAKPNISTIQQLSIFPGIANIIEFESNYFNILTNSLNELIKAIDRYLKSNSEQNKVSLEYKAMGSLPFHQRAIKDRLKKRKYLFFNELEPDVFSAYIDVKKIKNRIFARIGRSIVVKDDFSKESRPPLPVKLLIFSPNTTQEISDFFRLTLSFNIEEVILTNENKKVKELVEETSKTLFKGISKIKYSIRSSLKKYIEINSDSKFIGFSLWAPLSEMDYYNNISSYRVDNKRTCVLIFGNEDRGLHYTIQKRIKMYRFGIGSSEPLRSSQAAAYALAIFNLVFNTSFK
jgi:hypothetical protein